MKSYKLIVEKSTVPVNTGEWLERTIKDYNKHKVKFDVASNPEFLREGSAIKDFLNPDRIVIGVKSAKAREILMELYKPLKAEIVVTDIKSAELIKHAANSFLATKISFINSISNICDLIGADVSEVARGIGLDRRIGKDFLNAGIGFGGFCFPKDLGAFIHIAQKCGYDFGILKEVQKVNEAQKSVFVEKIETMLKRINGKTIAVLGLSFKPDTDDIRFAPSIDVISALLKRGARVRAYDPAAMPKARGVLGKRVKMCKDAYEAARGSDCLVIATEWNEFKELNLKRMKKILRQPVIVDGRNIYDPDEVRSAGFRYAGMGRR
jgi:UDPglucose 6-dehydrogenase